MRPGNTAFGAAEVEFIELAIDDVRKVIGPQRLLHVRIDSAGDCTEIMAAIHAKGALFVTKADMTADLCATIHAHRRWSTVDEDANGEPTRQVAVIPFRRKQWGTDKDLPVKVIAVRSRDRDSGKQLYLWDGLDYTVQVYLTNDQYSDPDDVARRYEGRAGIEPLIAEWKKRLGHRQDVDCQLPSQQRAVAAQAPGAQPAAPLRPREDSAARQVAHGVDSQVHDPRAGPHDALRQAANHPHADPPGPAAADGLLSVAPAL